MSIFGTKKLTLDDILKGIQNLSDEDRSKLNEALTTPQSEPQPAPAGEATPEDAEPTSPVTEPEAPEEGEEKPVRENEDSSELAKENDPEEAPQGAEDDGSAPEAEAQEETPSATPNEEYEALFAAMQARLDEMTELVSNLTERCNALTESLDGGSFGNHSPGMPSGGIDEEGEMTPTMRSYTRKQTYR